MSLYKGNSLKGKYGNENGKAIKKRKKIEEWGDLRRKRGTKGRL